MGRGREDVDGRASRGPACGLILVVWVDAVMGWREEEDDKELADVRKCLEGAHRMLWGWELLKEAREELEEAARHLTRHEDMVKVFNEIRKRVDRLRDR